MAKETENKKDQPFLTDVTALRKRARQHIQEGAVTEGYGGNTRPLARS